MANDKNNAKNLEALAKLKELGITDLSPEAVLAMVQSHLDTQSNLRKDNCQKQKEIVSPYMLSIFLSVISFTFLTTNLQILSVKNQVNIS